MGKWDWLGPILGSGNNLGGALGQLFGKQIAKGRPALRMSGGSWTPGSIVSERPTGRAGSALGLPQPGSIEEILAELRRLQDPGRYSVDSALLERQAMAAAAAQYDPITAALAQQGSAAQSRANRNSAQLKSMYTGLSQSLLGDIAPIQQQYADTQAKTGQQYAQLQQQIKDQYASSQAEQEAMMKRLNIEAAAPAVLPEQQRDRDFAVNTAAVQGQNVQDQLSQQGSGAVTYTRQGSQLAQTEGTNRQADLMATLADYLNQVQGQIGANQAAKSAAYQSNLMSLQQDASKSAVQNAQRDFENYLKVIGVMQNLQPKTKEAGPVKSPLDIGPRVMGSFGLDANSAQQVQNAFMSAVSSDDLILAGVDPGSGMSLTKEALAKRVVDMGRQRGLPAHLINALENIALEYFGRQ